jgi:hypothetical protein
MRIGAGLGSADGGRETVGAIYNFIIRVRYKDLDTRFMRGVGRHDYTAQERSCVYSKRDVGRHASGWHHAGRLQGCNADPKEFRRKHFTCNHSPRLELCDKSLQNIRLIVRQHASGLTSRILGHT